MQYLIFFFLLFLYSNAYIFLELQNKYYAFFKKNVNIYISKKKIIKCCKGSELLYLSNPSDTTFIIYSSIL